ncbi:penicillin-binding protein 2 [Iamia sp. SCSIO 61187]|uniref:peptidoglycan D,D-transpeptidase FtsI family protein n=1 Tax=Iamia sp. SCSIO 61187 TaxID=2722752 RepID=UPI001C62829C|nr:penicillin-binding transpeptidase domain-containing protein [Iamia sp. SCSIO 61187]QYG91052.1 penicillin-binding protein 2 [Iamia sp. SCSIO 61187]
MTMDRQIKKLGIALAVCFGILFAQLNYIQFWAADSINDRPGNSRQEQRQFNQPRGDILSADGVVLATSEAQGEGFAFRRLYPEGELFGPVTGYYSFNLGLTGVEASYDEDLSGSNPELDLQRLSDLFDERERFGNVELTLSAAVQRIATEQLGGREGSVVALDPRTGAIDAMVSFPSFDPGPLSTNDRTSTDIKRFLDADPENPLLFRAYQEIFFPGSTFKVVTATGAVERNVVSETEPVYPQQQTFDIDFTDNDLGNFGGATCGGSLFPILQESCNTAFAQMGVDLGSANLAGAAEGFGFNSEIPIDMPNPAVSVIPETFPTDQGNGPLARAAIGQGDVQASPLQMALVAAGLANRGAVMTPHVMARITDQDGEEVRAYEETEWRRAASAEAAEIVRRGMIATAEQGTASGLLIPGMEVGGKTGTAQLGTDPPRSHAWIIGFAGPPGGESEVAVAVIVEGQDGASEQTGGTVAAPIARAVMEAVLQERGDR